MKLESWQSSEYKKLWKIVRRDDCTDVIGDIVMADEESGECCVQINGETKSLKFGMKGIKLVGRR